MTKVTVNFLTYAPSMESERVKYAQIALKSLVKNLSFKEGDLRWHIADDGSPVEYCDLLSKIILDAGYPLTGSATSHTGYGGSYNRAARQIHPDSDLVMPCEDDWELLRPLDISDMVRAIEESQGQIQCIRMGYIGWSNELFGKLIQHARQTFLLFDPNSTEVHVFTGHPRLETVEFEKRIGPWPENLKAGWTEMEICNRVASRIGVCWPLDAGINASQDYCNLFSHIGDIQAE